MIFYDSVNSGASLSATKDVNEVVTKFTLFYTPKSRLGVLFWGECW